jgi:hypothetical protein
MKESNRYVKIIESIFHKYFKKGCEEVAFKREDIEKAAKKLSIKLPKNLGDIIYSFRSRIPLPDSVKAKAPKGKQWILRGAGISSYRFVAVTETTISPTKMMAETKVPDSTPGVIAKYAFNDEQALLAKLRYNRLIDIFTGVACYSLQNHLRTTVPNIGQIETDEIYIGIDKSGVHYVFPVQAKGAREKLGIVQIEQDVALCAHKFPHLVCRPVAAQFMKDNLIALFAFEVEGSQVSISSERHYRLVLPEALTVTELETYRNRLPSE